jgi:AcrR family transcriptional regulator
MATQSGTDKGERKRALILDGARGAFLTGGFHATSMQDLCRATATTPGAFYRYFPSKDALVQALVGEAIAHLATAVGAAMTAEPKSVSDALLPAIFAIDAMERMQGGARLALLIWAEAQRSHDLAQTIGAAIRPMLDAIDGLAEALLKHGVVTQTVDSKEVAVILGGILQGYVVQRAMFGIEPETYALGLGAVTHRR